MAHGPCDIKTRSWSLNSAYYLRKFCDWPIPGILAVLTVGSSFQALQASASRAVWFERPVVVYWLLAAAPMAQVAQIIRSFPSEEGIKRALEFKCRPDDFLICTSPKCGTTLMQQVHASFWIKSKVITHLTSLA